MNWLVLIGTLQRNNTSKSTYIIQKIEKNSKTEPFIKYLEIFAKYISDTIIN